MTAEDVIADALRNSIYYYIGVDGDEDRVAIIVAERLRSAGYLLDSPGGRCS